MDSHDWDARYAGSQLVWREEPNEFVEAELGDLPPGTAVDLAAGEGRNALWLARKGWRVTAVDFSPVGLEKGRRLLRERGGSLPGSVEWVCADVTSWVAPAPVDLALIAYLQLPADQRRAAVRGAFDSLVPGGTLLLVAHDSSNLTEGTGGPQDPAVLMTADDVLADLAGTTYDVVRAGRVARRVPGAAGTDGSDDEHGGEPDRTAWDVLVRLVRRQDPSRGSDGSEGSDGATRSDGSPSGRGSSP